MIRCEITVNSSFGSFPLDMLRYDCCWPATSEDAAKLVKAIRGEYLSKDKHPSIRIATYVQNKKEAKVPWTTARWASFGCVLSNPNTLY